MIMINIIIIIIIILIIMRGLARAGPPRRAANRPKGADWLDGRWAHARWGHASERRYYFYKRFANFRFSLEANF